MWLTRTAALLGLVLTLSACAPETIPAPDETTPAAPTEAAPTEAAPIEAAPTEATPVRARSATVRRLGEFGRRPPGVLGRHDLWVL